MLATQNEIAAIYDIVTGQKIREMKPVVSNNYAKNRATFDPSDELVLNDVRAHYMFFTNPETTNPEFPISYLLFFVKKFGFTVKNDKFLGIFKF